MKSKFRNVLDLGCGTGVLAIAAAKLWSVPVIASDIDHVAVGVTVENAEANGEAARVHAVLANGLDEDELRTAAPFDLMVANILSGPLIKLAKPLAKALAPRGIVVLSGLMRDEEDKILRAYTGARLKNRRIMRDGPWSALMFRSQRNNFHLPHCGEVENRVEARFFGWGWPIACIVPHPIRFAALNVSASPQGGRRNFFNRHATKRGPRKMATAPMYNMHKMTPPLQTYDDVSNKATVAPRLSALRAELARRGLDGFIIPRADEHQGEYVPPRGERLAYITSFTGSAGVAVVLKEKAAVFVDGRYTLQVREQTDTKLFEPRDLVSEGPLAWLEVNLPKGAKLGYDPWLHSIAGVEALKAAVERAGGTAVATEGNPIDATWKDQPGPPLDKAHALPRRTGGRERGKEAHPDRG